MKTPFYLSYAKERRSIITPNVKIFQKQVGEKKKIIMSDEIIIIHIYLDLCGQTIQSMKAQFRENLQKQPTNNNIKLLS